MFVTQNTVTLKLQVNNCIAAKEQILYDALQGVQRGVGVVGRSRRNNLNTELFLMQTQYSKKQTGTCRNI